MKQKLLNLLTLLFGFLVSCAIFIGLLERNNTVRSILGILFALICAGLWFVIVDLICHSVSTYIRTKKKKKTSERQIELQVLYQLRNYPNVTIGKSFFTKDNLVDCVFDAIDYAKRYNYIINKMWYC